MLYRNKKTGCEWNVAGEAALKIVKADSDFEPVNAPKTKGKGAKTDDSDDSTKTPENEAGN